MDCTKSHIMTSYEYIGTMELEASKKGCGLY
jgi:hypothetical protein